MKQIVISAFLLIMLTSCSVKNEQVDYPLLFNGTVNFTYNDTTFEANISYNGIGQMKLEMTEPNELIGIIVICNYEKFEVIKDDVSVEYDIAHIAGVPMFQLYTVLESLNKLKPTFISLEDVLLSKAEVDGIEYEVYLDSDNKTLKSIKTSNCIFEFH